MSKVPANGITFEVTDRGQGRPLVLVHGVLCSGRFFARQLAHFPRHHRWYGTAHRCHTRPDKHP